MLTGKISAKIHSLQKLKKISNKNSGTNDLDFDDCDQYFLIDEMEWMCGKHITLEWDEGSGTYEQYEIPLIWIESFDILKGV